jgi:hypothetical protein
VSAANPLGADAPEDWSHRRPSARRLVRRATYRVTLALTGRDLTRAIRAADRFGALLHRWRLQPPSAATLAELLGRTDRAPLEPAARASAALRLKNHVAIAAVGRRGLTGLGELIRPPVPLAELADRPRGIVLVTVHLGAPFGVRAALERWTIPVIRLRDLELRHAEGRARGLKEAVDALRRGGVVLAVLDGPGGTSTEPVPCLGRQIVFRRGPLVLARLTGAPIVPVVSSWTPDHHIELRLGATLAAASRDQTTFEPDAAAVLARWFEDHIRAHPEDLWPFTIRNLLAAPRCR